MVKRFMKYNPAFLPEQELVDSFVVRLIDFDLIMKIIRENTDSSSNQHILVVGPRGSGKTTLVRRIAAELRHAEDLKAKWYPLVFAEESYEVGTIGEFWLAALFHLKEQTRDMNWQRTYEELKKERDDKRLQERALASLMDFADSQKKRILFIVENFNMLLGDQISKDDAWVLRHTLQNEPRIMLLATATTRFEEVDNASHAMFELFKNHELKPLTEAECKAVWRLVVGQEPKDDRIRPMQILTGGNPRLMVIISAFGATLSFKELMDNLMQLVDDHTEYFKNHLDNLPQSERKVYLALTELWDPSTAREIALTARLDVNATSSLLKRLIGRGAVVAHDTKPNKEYQVAERLYNIYYLMRKRGAPSDRVKAVVSFIVAFYNTEELVNIACSFAKEAGHLSPEFRRDIVMAYKTIIDYLPSSELRDQLFSVTPPDFLEMEEVKALKLAEQLRERKIAELFKKVLRLAKQPKAKESLRKIQRTPQLWEFLGLMFDGYGEYEKAAQAYRKAISLKPDYAEAWANLGKVLHDRLHRYEEALLVAQQGIEKNPGNLDLLNGFAWIFYKGQNYLDQAEAWARAAVSLASNEIEKALVHHTLACILCALNRGAEALESARKYLKDAQLVATFTEDAIELCVGLAAAGLAREALELLQTSALEKSLEPMAVALRLYLQEDVRVATEILEVAKDVVKRIQARAQKQSSPRIS